MIKVIVPKDNDNINIYFNTRAAYNDINKFNNELLCKVLSRSLGENFGEYDIVFENRQAGQYIIVETENEKTWISFSADYTIREDDTGSTNAYFVESIPMALCDYYLNATTKAKKIELYLMGTSHNRAKTLAQQIYYRLAKTVGIKILNEDVFDLEIRRNITFPFEDINEWKLARLNMRSSNTGNKPSYIIENDDSYTFYGKTFGANGRESIFILYVLAHLAKKEDKDIYLYEVADNGSFSFEVPRNNEEYTKFKTMLTDLGIIYYIDHIEYVDNEEFEKLDDQNKTSRYQAEFMRNLLIKFNSKRDANGNLMYVNNNPNKPIINDDMKRCYLCNCDIQGLIIASHIHRVKDIDRLDLPFIEKRKLAVDGDNGLWLCANHDKLFENGLIYFDGDVMQIRDHVSNLQKKFIYVSTFYLKKLYTNSTENEDVNFIRIDDDLEFHIKPEHYNDKMHGYLEIHKNRTDKLYENINCEVEENEQ